MAAAGPKERKRECCARCQRPPRVCYCASLPPQPLATVHTHVLIVQHRHEKRHRNAISSVPVLAQVLDQRAVTIAIVDDDGALGAPGSSDELDSLLYPIADVNGDVQFETVFVLFPDTTAKTLNAELLESLGPQPPPASAAVSREAEATIRSSSRAQTLLVVIDGTWTEAKKIVFHTKMHLEALAKQRRALDKAFEFICLDDDAHGDGDDSGDAMPRQSIYGDLRREPMEGCLSTLEAVALALQVLEPSTTSHLLRDALLRGFQGMVAIQTQFMKSGKQQTLERYNGVSKHDAMLQRKREGEEAEVSQRAASKDAEAQKSDRAQKLTLIREYVFFATHVDFRQRRERVQQGASVTCTYDEARAKCQELNRERKRGQRLAVQPLESFLQQQTQQQTE